MAVVFVLTRHEGDVEAFFIGSDRYGRVRWSVFWADAAKFTSARAAYECATTHPGLCNSDEWRVIEITDRCERTR